MFFSNLYAADIEALNKLSAKTAKSFVSNNKALCLCFWFAVIGDKSAFAIANLKLLIKCRVWDSKPKLLIKCRVWDSKPKIINKVPCLR